ncbi:MAG: hypothetical protein QOD83_4548, partial [Solirubrobacteraceae bacterium]|nr:hypothetical protein [Solirubrobacteraceae bacterium]
MPGPYEPVLGEIAADDNTRGVVGVAPSLASLRVTSYFDGVTAVHVADAAIAALPTMNAGDVLLMEVQRGSALLPTETDPADFDAIRLASARGMIVVAAAGNGGSDLDAWTDVGGFFRLNRGQPDFRDSGAVMVGAALSGVVGGSHTRRSSSKFGSRIDCYGWGTNVTTTGYGDLTPGAPIDQSYTAVFNGTSSAAPIVVGAAVLTQSMYLAATGTRLSPGQMRAILSDPATGTPQSAVDVGNIGVMPNVRRVMPNVRRIGEEVLGLVPTCTCATRLATAVRSRTPARSARARRHRPADARGQPDGRVRRGQRHRERRDPWLRSRGRRRGAPLTARRAPTVWLPCHAARASLTLARRHAMVSWIVLSGR